MGRATVKMRIDSRESSESPFKVARKRHRQHQTRTKPRHDAGEIIGMATASIYLVYTVAV
jgi:hypothetical protein